MNKDMEQQMREYRTEHPKCYFCIWSNHMEPKAVPEVKTWWECDLKGKVIKHPMWKTFCKEYRVK